LQSGKKGDEKATTDKSGKSDAKRLRGGIKTEEDSREKVRNERGKQARKMQSDPSEQHKDSPTMGAWRSR